MSTLIEAKVAKYWEYSWKRICLAVRFSPWLLSLRWQCSLHVEATGPQSVQSHEEAALDLGAGRWQVLRDIVIPVLMPAIVSSLLLVLAFSFDDVALSLALRGPNDTTVPIYIFSAVQRRVTPSIHAIGAMVIFAGVLTFAAAAAINRAVFGGVDRAS